MIRIAVLHARYTETLSYYDDWLDAFCHYPGFDCVPVDICRQTPRTAGEAVTTADAVVLLHSTNADSLTDLQPWLPVLQARKGRLLAFPGNEVNLPGVRMAERIEFLRAAGTDWIATQLLPETGKWLYDRCTSATVISLPHALNPDAFHPGPAHRERRFDFVARSYAYPPYLGDDDRQRLFAAVAKLPLQLDIDGVHRLDRAGWANLLAHGRGTVSTEAGSFYLEKDDTTVLAIREYLLGQQSGKVVPLTVGMQKLLNLLPGGLRRAILQQRSRIEASLRRLGVRSETSIYSEADFSEIFNRFFAGKARPPVYGKCISSRHFDAVGTKTCQVLVEGRYNDILRPHEHYILLRHDLTNLDDAIAQFRDESLRLAMVERTYQFICDTHTYRQRMQTVHSLLTDNVSECYDAESIIRGSL